MAKRQLTLNLNGQLVRSRKAYIEYDPFKKRKVYFVPRTGKSYVINATNKRKLFLAGDLDLQGEIFLNSRIVKDSARN